MKKKTSSPKPISSLLQVSSDEIQFSEGNHQYRVNKIPVPSVTTIIGVLNKPALIHWAAGLTAEYFIKNIPKIVSGELSFTEADAGEMYARAKTEHMRESAKATDIGSAAHDAIEQFVKTRAPIPKPRIKTGKAVHAYNSVKRYEEWERQIGVKQVIGSEIKIYHPDYKYAGMVDLLLQLSTKENMVVDLKTSAAFYEPDMPLQLAAYAKGVEKTYGFPIHRIGILRISKKTGEMEWKEYTPLLDDCFNAFTSLATFVHFNRLNAKFFKDLPIFPVEMS